MSKLSIITNNHWRQYKYGYELPVKVRADFDYMTDETFETSNFIHYKGNYISLDEFMRIDKNAPSEFQDYDGYSSDSYFSGLLIKMSPDGEEYQIATYLS